MKETHQYIHYHYTAANVVMAAELCNIDR